MKIPSERCKELWKVYRERYRTCIEAIRHDHLRLGAAGGAHDFYHAAITAQLAVRIATDELNGHRAYLAGLSHNTDHLYRKDEVKLVVSRYLDFCRDLSKEDCALIMDAVVSHGEPPAWDDSMTLVILRDADWVANAGVQVIMRAGQYYWDAQAFDPDWVEKNDPTTTEKRPRTVWRDIRELYEWEKKIRLPVAKELFARHMALIRMAENDLLFTLQESGMYPCPREYYVPAPEPSGKHP